MNYLLSLSKDEQDFFTAHERIMKKDYGCSLGLNAQSDNQGLVMPDISKKACTESSRQFIRFPYKKTVILKPTVDIAA